MRTRLILFLSFFLVKCNQVDKQTTTLSSPQTLDRKTEVKEIISSIQSDELVEGEVIGSCWARKSDIYPKFVEINSMLSDSELVDLTAHIKPNIRAYAFWFLAKRQYKKIGDIYKTLKKDTAEIILRYNSEQWVYKMPNFVYFILTPNMFDTSTIKLDAKTLSKLDKSS